MTAAEWTAFVSATRQLMQGQAPTAYDSLVNMRVTYARSVIGYPQYLPWQRRYLQEFERRLQAINPNVMIPYWDTGLDSQAPASSPLFSSKYLGGNGVSPNRCVSDGPFAGWNPYYPRKHCLTRSFDRGTTLSAFHPTATIEQLLTSSRDYVAIRTALEYTLAARPANSIGGDMATVAAPNDPIFWLHAAFIDKLWADWQQRWPATAKSYAGANANGTRASLTDKLAPLSGAVGDVMATSALCYAY